MTTKANDVNGMWVNCWEDWWSIREKDDRNYNWLLRFACSLTDLLFKSDEFCDFRDNVVRSLP